MDDMKTVAQIVVPIFGQDLDSIVGQALDAKSAGADILELRLDLCAAVMADLDSLINAISGFSLPVIATNRSKQEGGKSPQNDAERIATLLAADKAGAAYIDVELSSIDALSERPQQAKLILSYHDFEAMGQDLPGKIQAMYAAGADIAKVAVTPSDAGDLATVEALYHDVGDKQLVAIAMGEEGLPSRLLAGAWGAPFTFATVNDQNSAPGQPKAQDLIDIYRIHEQGPETCIFGVIGDPVGHSLSPIIHNAGFAHLDLDAVYVPFLVHDVKDFWQKCQNWIDGISITIPHKHDLIELMDECEDLVTVTGAMNTIYRNEEKCVAANTDSTAALTCIQEHSGSLEGARCLVLGAGGVSRAIAHTLHSVGANVFITNRTMARAEELAKEIGCQTIALDDAINEDFAVLINGTSVGMNSDESPWPADKHKSGRIVFDTVYTPLETRLLCDAQAAGSFPICGLSMFLRQAYQQFERWTNGGFAPEAAMRRVVLEKLGIDPSMYGNVGKNNTACWNNG